MNSPKKKLILSVILIVVGFIVFGFWNSQKPKLISSEAETVDVLKAETTPTPTTVPYILDDKSDLKSELEKLTPPDISADYKALSDEISQF